MSQNDFHYATDPKTGQRSIQPGLGPDEPSVAKRAKMDADAALLRARRVELATLEQKIKGQISDHETREAVMQAREAELDEQLREGQLKLDAMQEQLKKLEEQARGTKTPVADDDKTG